MESEFPGRLSISSQPLSSRSSGPLATRSSMIPALTRSAGGGDEASEAALGGSARWRWRPAASARWQESSTALPTGWMMPAPQSVLPRLPQRLRLRPGRGGQPLRQGGPPSPAPPPRGADHRKGGGGGSEGNGGWGRKGRCKQKAALVRSPEMGPEQPASGRPTLCSSAHSGAYRERDTEQGARPHLSG